MEIWVTNEEKNFFGAVKSFQTNTGSIMNDDCAIVNENNIRLMGNLSLQKCKEALHKIESIIKIGVKYENIIFIDMALLKKEIIEEQ